jgi:predicted small metal-binding protein
MAQHSTKCPICSGTISAETEDALVKQFQQHAKEKHNRDMNEQQVRETIKKQANA